jgi:hypothetical protein
VEDLQKRLDRFVGAKVREALNRPIPDVDVVVVQRREKNLRGALRFDATAPEQADIPEGIGTRSLFAATRGGLLGDRLSPTTSRDSWPRCPPRCRLLSPGDRPS